MSEYEPHEDVTRRRPAGAGWVDSLSETRPQRVPPPPAEPEIREKRRGLACSCSCGCLGPLLFALLLLAVYLLAPGRTNLLLLGVDAREGEGVVGRTDTNILVTMLPWEGKVGMLSIPRDLWVVIPGRGENRINTAHFFAEAEQSGSGPQAALETVRLNFGVTVSYYVRIRFEGLKQVVDALGGVEIDLPEPASGYPAGRHTLDGDQALAFVRDRQGSDDFFRMARGQLFLRGLLRSLLEPAKWPRLPAFLEALPQFLDTDVPFWLWPRLGLTLVRAGPAGIDSQVITREMVTPFTTTGGAAVLAPNWEQINPLLLEMFGE